jgi:hypothetical protein
VDAAVLDLTGALQDQGEVGLALAVDLGVEHLVLEVNGGLRLEVDVGAGGLDDLIVRRSRAAVTATLRSAKFAGDMIRRPEPRAPAG